jgi:hypothetical protein
LLVRWIKSKNNRRRKMLSGDVEKNWKWHTRSSGSSKSLSTLESLDERHGNNVSRSARSSAFLKRSDFSKRKNC